ncbi:hypothetical protein [Streptomyces sp. JNUCC 63]
MNLTELHRRLLADVLAAGSAYPLALTGGYAVQLRRPDGVQPMYAPRAR